MCLYWGLILLSHTWNVGMVEYWGKGGKKQFKLLKTPLNPSFQYSIIPIFQSTLLSSTATEEGL